MAASFGDIIPTYSMSGFKDWRNAHGPGKLWHVALNFANWRPDVDHFGTRVKPPVWSARNKTDGEGKKVSGDKSQRLITVLFVFE